MIGEGEQKKNEGRLESDPLKLSNNTTFRPGENQWQYGFDVVYHCLPRKLKNHPHVRLSDPADTALGLSHRCVEVKNKMQKSRKRIYMFIYVTILGTNIYTWWKSPECTYNMGTKRQDTHICLHAMEIPETASA